MYIYLEIRRERERVYIYGLYQHGRLEVYKYIRRKKKSPIRSISYAAFWYLNLLLRWLAPQRRYISTHVRWMNMLLMATWIKARRLFTTGHHKSLKSFPRGPAVFYSYEQNDRASQAKSQKGWRTEEDRGELISMPMAKGEGGQLATHLFSSRLFLRKTKKGEKEKPKVHAPLHIIWGSNWRWMHCIISIFSRFLPGDFGRLGWWPVGPAS